MWLPRLAVLALLASTAHADPDRGATERRPDRVALAYTLGVAGVAGLATALGLGLYAHHEYEASFDNHDCVANRCNAEGFANTGGARTLGNVATGLAVGSAALTAVAAIIYVTAPRDRVMVVPVAEPHGAGMSLAMRF